MSKRNENRPGYKKTKVGWIPEEWDVVKFGSYINHVKGFAFKSSDYQASGRRIIRVSDTTYDSFKDENPIYIEKEKARMYKRYELKIDDLIFTTVGSKPPMYDSMVGKVIKVPKMYENTLLNQNAVLIRTKNHNLLNQKYLHSVFKTKRYTYFIETIFRGNANQASITLEDLFLFPIHLPPLPKQKKIAEILSKWDEAIEQTRKLIEAKKRRKKALMQQLLTGKMRFKDNGGNDWRIRPLGELVEPVLRPVPKPKEPYLSIGLRSHGRGTFQKIVKLPEKVMMDTLYRIESQDIIVNITFAWEGAIAIAKENDSGGLVSHRFPTYRIKDKKANIDFFRNLILTKKFVWDLGLISPGGAGRNRVMNKMDFLKLKVLLPPVEIQRELGRILTTADNEIKVLEDYRNAIEKQKRGLMQKLLTGEVRVIV